MEGGAFAGLGFDFDAAMVRLDDGFALEHADADAFLFGGIKGAKKRMPDEIGCHSAAIIGRRGLPNRCDGGFRRESVRRSPKHRARSRRDWSGLFEFERGRCGV